jgi:hypothetical protein
VKTGRQRPRGNLQQWARQQQAIAAGNRFYAPPPATGDQSARPAWLVLGARVRADGQVLGVVSIRPKPGGGWELLGHLTARRWYDSGEVEPL